MDQPLTIVLPMYNRERQLRSSVMDILDLTQAMPRPVQIVIVDDGSTDDTYETACELARTYPQMTVLRQSVHQGLGAALELVRNRLTVEMVVVHDGVSAIDAAQLQTLLQEAATATGHGANPLSTSSRESSGSRRFAAVRALHNRLEQVHRTATNFRWMQLEKPLVPRRRSISPASISTATTETGTPAQSVPIQLVNLPLGTNPIAQP